MSLACQNACQRFDAVVGRTVGLDPIGIEPLTSRLFTDTKCATNRRPRMVHAPGPTNAESQDQTSGPVGAVGLNELTELSVPGFGRCNHATRLRPVAQASRQGRRGH